jgi:uncharacterized alpha-E superfamily protein
LLTRRKAADQRIPGFLSNLVARFASNLYWLGRYLERAENLARILEINETYARDPASGPSWRKMLELNADDARFEKVYGTPTAESVIFFYLIDRNNAASIHNCTRIARENARSVRHLISTEMWTQLNVFYGKLARIKEQDATVKNVTKIARNVISGCQSFEGIAEGTFLRGEPWCFYQLGKYIERADQTTRILDMGYDRLTPSGEDAVAWVHWNVLLRTVCGYHAYRSRHPGASSPHEIAAFLLYDDEFPRAVALCVERLTGRLRELERRHRSRSVFNLEMNRRNLEFLVETGPGKGLTSNELHTYLDNVQAALATLSDSIHQRYFLGT